MFLCLVYVSYNNPQNISTASRHVYTMHACHMYTLYVTYMDYDMSLLPHAKANGVGCAKKRL